MMDEPVIKADELYAELNKFAEKSKYREPILTEEQYQLLRLARENTEQISWSVICEFFRLKNWGDIPDSTLNGRYLREKRKREKNK